MHYNIGTRVRCEGCNELSMVINQLCSSKLEWKCYGCGYSRTFSVFAVHNEIKAKRNDEQHTIMVDTLYSNAIRKLIDYSFEKQRGFMYRRNMDKLDYINEFCTITMRGPRQSGHSRAVNDLARLYDAWIVSPTLKQGEINHKGWKKLCTPRSFDRVRGSSSTVVLCDGVADLTDGDIEVLHEMSIGQRVFALVYMGCLPRA